MDVVDLVEKLKSCKKQECKSLYIALFNILTEAREDTGIQGLDANAVLQCSLSHMCSRVKENPSEAVLRMLSKWMARKGPDKLNATQKKSIVDGVISFIANYETAEQASMAHCFHILCQFLGDGNNLHLPILSNIVTAISYSQDIGKSSELAKEGCALLQQIILKNRKCIYYQRKFQTAVFYNFFNEEEEVRAIAQQNIQLMVIRHKDLEIVKEVVCDMFRKHYPSSMEKLFMKAQEVSVLEKTKLLMDVAGYMFTDNQAAVNGLMPLMERAFKHEKEEVRIKAFEVWRTLINNVSLSNSVISVLSKLILLMKPLQKCATRSDTILRIKCETWWKLVHSLEGNLAEYFPEVCCPLLEFTCGDSTNSSGALAQEQGGVCSNVSQKKYRMKVGCDILLRFFDRPLTTTVFYRSSRNAPIIGLDPLPSSVCTSVFPKFARHLFTAAKHLFRGFVNDYEMLPKLEHLLILMGAAVLNLPDHPKVDDMTAIELYSCLFCCIVREELLPGSFILKFINKLGRFPKHLLTCHYFGIPETTIVNANLCLALISFILSPTLIPVPDYKSRCLSLFQHLTKCGISMSPSPVSYTSSIMYFMKDSRMIEISDTEMLLNLWTIVSSALYHALLKVESAASNEDCTEDFSPICEVLLYPFKYIDNLTLTKKVVPLFEVIDNTIRFHGMEMAIDLILELYLTAELKFIRFAYQKYFQVLASSTGEDQELSAFSSIQEQPAYQHLCYEYYYATLKHNEHLIPCKVHLDAWRNLYSLFYRHASQLEDLEMQNPCDAVCFQLMAYLWKASGKILNGNKAISVVLPIIVECISSADIEKKCESYHGNKSPHDKTPQDVLQCFTPFIGLIKWLLLSFRTICSSEHRQQDYDMLKILMSCVDTFIKFLLKVTSSKYLAAILGEVSRTLANIFELSQMRNINTKEDVHTIQEQLQNSWNDMCSHIQQHYADEYDTAFLNIMSPLFESTLRHPRLAIRNRSREFWFASFGPNLSKLKLPSTMVEVIAKLRPPLQSFSFNEGQTCSPAVVQPVTSLIKDKNSSPVKKARLSKAAEIEKTSIPWTPMIFEVKSTSPGVEKTIPVRTEVIAVDDLPSKEFVVICSPPTGKKVLTESQKEARKKRSFVPAMYNELSQSSCPVDSLDTLDSLPSLTTPGNGAIPTMEVIGLDKNFSQEVVKDTKGDVKESEKLDSSCSTHDPVLTNWDSYGDAAIQGYSGPFSITTPLVVKEDVIDLCDAEIQYHTAQEHSSVKSSVAIDLTDLTGEDVVVSVIPTAQFPGTNNDITYRDFGVLKAADQCNPCDEDKTVTVDPLPKCDYSSRLSAAVGKQKGEHARPTVIPPEAEGSGQKADSFDAESGCDIPESIHRNTAASSKSTGSDSQGADVLSVSSQVGCSFSDVLSTSCISKSSSQESKKGKKIGASNEILSLSDDPLYVKTRRQVLQHSTRLTRSKLKGTKVKNVLGLKLMKTKVKRKILKPRVEAVTPELEVEKIKSDDTNAVDVTVTNLENSNNKSSEEAQTSDCGLPRGARKRKQSVPSQFYCALDVKREKLDICRGKAENGARAKNDASQIEDPLKLAQTDSEEVKVPNRLPQLVQVGSSSPLKRVQKISSLCISPLSRTQKILKAARSQVVSSEYVECSPSVKPKKTLAVSSPTGLSPILKKGSSPAGSNMKKVSFTEPLVQGEMLIQPREEPKSQRTVKKRLKLFHSTVDKNGSELEPTVTSTEPVSPLCAPGVLLSDPVPSCSSMSSCSEPLTVVPGEQEVQNVNFENLRGTAIGQQPMSSFISLFTSPMWEAGLLKLLRARNIAKVEDLSSLTYEDFSLLPIASPKLKTLQTALQTLQSFNVVPDTELNPQALGVRTNNLAGSPSDLHSLCVRTNNLAGSPSDLHSLVNNEEYTDDILKEVISSQVLEKADHNLLWTLLFKILKILKEKNIPEENTPSG